jgi:hypothetical protein
MARTRTYNPDRDVSPWKGGARPYDIAKELTVTFIVVAVLTIGLAVLFGSPDDTSVTLKSWSNADQVDFATTAITELDGTSGSATYGPPYNHGTDGVQKLGPVSIQKFAGVHIPVNPAKDFVLDPLSTVTGKPELTTALATWKAADEATRVRWTAAYEKSVADATVKGGILVVPSGRYGPVAVMIQSLTQMATSGALDASTINHAGFYSTDYTKSLLFVADGSYFAGVGDSQHLAGEQWGMMNETGSFPGQPWLWLYSLWYQIPPFNGDSAWGANADAIIWFLMIGITLLFMLIPFIPGLRSIPRWSRIYRIIWRDSYRTKT